MNWCSHDMCTYAVCVRACGRAGVHACMRASVRISRWLCAGTHMCALHTYARVLRCISCGHKSLVVSRFYIPVYMHMCIRPREYMCVHIYTAEASCATTRNTLRTRTSKQTQSNQFARLIDFPSHGRCRAAHCVRA